MLYCHVLCISWHVHANFYYLLLQTFIIANFYYLHQLACACKLLLFACIHLHLHNTRASVLRVRMCVYVCVASIWSCSSWSHHLHSISGITYQAATCKHLKRATHKLMTHKHTHNAVACSMQTCPPFASTTKVRLKDWLLLCFLTPFLPLLLLSHSLCCS